MAATQDTFPSFAEVSRQARDIERSMISVRQSQIAGKLHPEDNVPIFPKEFDEYTAAYLVSEAQKVERRLFASNYQSSLTASSPSQQQARQSLEQIEAEELHQLATAPPPLVSQQPSSEQQKPSFAEQMANIKFPSFQFGKSAQPQVPAQQQAQPQSPYSQPPAQSQSPSSSAVPSYQQQYAQPPVYSQTVSVPPSAPRIPSAVRAAEETEKDAEEKMGREKEEFAKPSEKEEWRDEAEEKAEPQPVQERSPPSKSSLMASSKVSPRLRAIIEEKLRREDQREAEKEADAVEEAEARAEPDEKQEEKEDETPVLSSRERLLRRLQKEKASWPQKEVEDAPEDEQAQETAEELEEEEAAGQKEEAPAESKPMLPLRKPAASRQKEEQPEEQEEKAEPEEEQGEPEERVKAKETPMRRRTELTDSAYGEETGKAEPAAAEPEAPAKKKSYRAPLLARTGGITIKPIFSGEAEEQGGQNEQPQDAESENRMDRIKRIVADLSPDKYKAQAIATSRSIQKEMDEGSEQTPEKGRKKRKTELADSESLQPEEGEQELHEDAEQVEPEEEEAALEEKKQMPLAKKAAPQKGGRKAAQQSTAKPAKKAVVAPAAAAQKKQKKQPVPKSQPPAKLVPIQAPVRPLQAKRAQAVLSTPEAAKPVLRQTPSGAQQPTARTSYPSAPARQTQSTAPQPVPRTAYSAAPASQRTAPQPVSSRAAYPTAPRAQMAQATNAAPSRAVPIQRIVPSVSPVQQAARQRAQVAPPAAPSTVLQRASVANIAAPRGNARPLRIFPGGSSQQALPRTYVPPVRRRPVPQEEEEQAAEPEVAAAEQGAQPEENAPGEEKPERINVTSAKARFAAGGAPASFSGVAPKKAVLEEPASEKTPEELEEERRVSEKAEKLSQMAKPKHEIAGDAELPAEQEEDTDIPMPPPDDAEPAPAEYEGAKEGFKRKTEQAGIREKTKEEVEAALEAYAKENLVWLHEIYAMGGMSKEDFLQKVKDKIAEETEGQPPPDAPANPALSNLGKEIDKRYKK